MAYDIVYSEEPPIIITEADDGYYHIFLEGEFVGLAHNYEEADLMAAEVHAAVTGEPQQEGDYL